MTTDIQKLLEIAKNSKKDIKWTDNEKKLDDLLTFFNKYNIIHGKDRISTTALHALYAATTKKEVSSKSFRVKVSKILKKTQTCSLSEFYVDLDALSIKIDEINKLVGPFLLEKAREEVQKEKKRSTEALRSGTNPT